MCKKVLTVSIPQAVSTVATLLFCPIFMGFYFCFNTASGKYCCNDRGVSEDGIKLAVSIPQAVSTVATKNNVQICSWKYFRYVSIPQAVSTVATEVRRGRNDKI